MLQFHFVYIVHIHFNSHFHHIHLISMSSYYVLDYQVISNRSTEILPFVPSAFIVLSIREVGKVSTQSIPSVHILLTSAV